MNLLNTIRRRRVLRDSESEDAHRSHEPGHGLQVASTSDAEGTPKRPRQSRDRAPIAVHGMLPLWVCIGKSALTRRWYVPIARVAALVVLATGLFANAQSTDDSTATDFSTFRIIPERNIFNPDRYGGNYHPMQFHSVPTFSLAGTMSYRKGMFAFFDGTRDDYQKALPQGGTIAGYTVTKITFDGVTLRAGGYQTNMTVGAAMQQEGDGWRLVPPGEWAGASTSEGGSGSEGGTETENSTNAAPLPLPPSGGGAESDVLKRLMQQRQQELK